MPTDTAPEPMHIHRDTKDGKVKLALGSELEKFTAALHRELHAAAHVAKLFSRESMGPPTVEQLAWIETHGTLMTTTNFIHVLANSLPELDDKHTTNWWRDRANTLQNNQPCAPPEPAPTPPATLYRISETNLSGMSLYGKFFRKAETGPGGRFAIFASHLKPGIANHIAVGDMMVVNCNPKQGEVDDRQFEVVAITPLAVDNDTRIITLQRI